MRRRNPTLLDRTSNVLFQAKNALARMVSAGDAFAEPVQVAKLNFFEEGAEGQAVKGVQTEEFWMNPPYGRPRAIDYINLKQFEKSEWVQICTDCILDAIVGAEWHIIPRDEDDEVRERSELSKRMKGMEDWIRSFPTEESFEYCIGAMLPDLLWYDAGVIIKTFPFINFDEEGKIKDPSKIIDLSVLDGRSFMIESGVIGGRRRRYWQYSWLTPGSIPTSFELDEVMYFMMRPNSRGVYGTSKLEIISNIVNYLNDAVKSNSRFLENGMFAGGQIDHPDIKDVDELTKRAKMYKSQLQGPEKAGKMLITGGGVTMKQFPFNNQQMQWLDGQKWYAKIVMSIFKVTPSEIGFTEDLNRATGIQQMNIHKSRAVKPILDLIERTINRHLIWPIDPTLKFQYSATLDAEDKMKQAQIDQIYLTTGVTSINEIRQREGKTEFSDPKFNEPFADQQSEEPEEEDPLLDSWDSFSDSESNEPESPPITKGGPGSGIKGHRTHREATMKHGNSEHLIILDENGKVLATNTGEEGAGEVENPKLKELRDPKRNLVLHHNHPDPGGSLSLPDICGASQLPGVKTTWAHSKEGSYKVTIPDSTNRDELFKEAKKVFWKHEEKIQDKMFDMLDAGASRAEAKAFKMKGYTEAKALACKELASKGLIEYEEHLEVNKALSVSALSGDPGYAPLPDVVDGHVKTEDLEESGINELSSFYQKLKEELLKQIEDVYGGDAK